MKLLSLACVFFAQGHWIVICEETCPIGLLVCVRTYDVLTTKPHMFLMLLQQSKIPHRGIVESNPGDEVLQISKSPFASEQKHRSQLLCTMLRTRCSYGSKDIKTDQNPSKLALSFLQLKVAATSSSWILLEF